MFVLWKVAYTRNHFWYRNVYWAVYIWCK